MDPLTAGITYSAGAGGAAGGGGMAAAMSNPITAAIAAAAAAAAYGSSPTVRKYVNKGAKGMWEKVSNPWQHFGDGGEHDKFGNFLNGQMDLPGGGGFLGKFLTNPENPGGQGVLDKVLDHKLRMREQQQQQKSLKSALSGIPGYGLPAPQTSNVPIISGQYRPPAPQRFNPLSPMLQGVY